MPGEPPLRWERRRRAPTDWMFSGRWRTTESQLMLYPKTVSPDYASQRAGGGQTGSFKLRTKFKWDSAGLPHIVIFKNLFLNLHTVKCTFFGVRY